MSEGCRLRSHPITPKAKGLETGRPAHFRVYVTRCFRAACLSSPAGGYQTSQPLSTVDRSYSSVSQHLFLYRKIYYKHITSSTASVFHKLCCLSCKFRMQPRQLTCYVTHLQKGEMQPHKTLCGYKGHHRYRWPGALLNAQLDTDSHPSVPQISLILKELCCRNAVTCIQ